MAAKRILLLCNGSIMGGAEIISLSVAKYLKERGHQVFCIVSGWSSSEFIKELEAMGVGYEKIKLGFLYLRKPIWTIDTLMHYPRALFKFIKIRNNFSPDVIYFYSCQEIIMLYFLLIPKQNIYHVQDYIPNSLKNRLIFRIIARKLRLFIACSSSIASDLSALGVCKDKIRTVVNGVEFKEGLKKASGSYSGPIRIGIIAQIIKCKGHACFIEALNILRKKNKDFICYIYGKGDLSIKLGLEKEIEEYGLRDLVKWQGFVNDQAEIYNNLDLVVVPSFSEAFGLVAAEAGFWGLPVVASKVGGLTEIVVDGKSGFLIDPGDVLNLSEKILYFINNPGEISRMGEYAKRHVSKNFDLTRMCRDIEALL